MWKQKLGICLANNYGIPTADVVTLVAKIGFDAISPVWRPGIDLKPIVDAAHDNHLTVLSLHAPNSGDNMWSSDPQTAKEALDILLASLAECERFHIPIMVVHVWRGFDFVPDATQEGLENFGRLVDQARAKGVKIAFENTEGEKLLYSLMDYFKDDDHVGFCWDSGHEMCYNRAEDLLSRLGDRLILTHLHDNLGIKDFDGNITSCDDLHLLPYDGIIDWDHTIEKLRRSKRQDVLNFEVKIESKANRHENDIYMQMSLEQFFTEAYKRACRIAFRYSK